MIAQYHYVNKSASLMATVLYQTSVHVKEAGQDEIALYQFVHKTATMAADV